MESELQEDHFMMQISLSKGIPEDNGYYLMQFADLGGPHLIYITQYLDGQRGFVIENDTKIWTLNEEQAFSKKLVIVNT